MENWQIKIIDKGYKYTRDVYIYRRSNHKTEVWYGDKVTVYEEGASMSDMPSFSMTPEMLQDLSDALNNIGIKPQKGFMEGKLEATERHLSDMRELVFKEPKI